MSTGTVQVPDHLAGACRAGLSEQGTGAEGLPDCFPRPAPLVLDLGCGNGVFLSALAAREASLNFLGVERKEYRVRQAERRCGGLDNARIFVGEVSEVLRMLPLRSVARAYLLFSDPWPKRRHAVRRVVQMDFVELLSTRLAAGGGLFFASDCAAYYRWAREMFASSGFWRVEPWVIPPDWPRTEFEQHFSTAGVPVSRFRATPVLPPSVLNPQHSHASD
jgi:tRNA (guanine-N7-)-methyltransferase